MPKPSNASKSVIKLSYDGDEYELTYTRESVKQMENTGFDIQAFIANTKPATMSWALFEGAFIARCRGTKRKLIEEIYEHVSNKTDLLLALAELYGNTLTTLTDSSVDTEKNVTWETA